VSNGRFQARSDFADQLFEGLAAREL